MMLRAVCLAAGMAVMSVVALDAQEQVSQAPGAVLRGLDKINGVTSDIELAAGTTAAFGTLQITLDDCRYPVGNPAGNAYAALEISEMGQTGTLFSGWMVASAPALSAMDHPRYDVWVMSCTTS